jgi:hypothetical protein
MVRLRPSTDAIGTDITENPRQPTNTGASRATDPTKANPIARRIEEGTHLGFAVYHLILSGTISKGKQSNRNVGYTVGRNYFSSILPSLETANGFTTGIVFSSIRDFGREL